MSDRSPLGPNLPAPVTDMTGSTHLPFTLTPAQREALSTRLMLQPPGTDSWRIEKIAIERIPLDVLFALDSLKMLADQGNTVAQALYERERTKWGIDRKLYSFPKS